MYNIIVFRNILSNNSKRNKYFFIRLVFLFLTIIFFCIIYLKTNTKAIHLLITSFIIIDKIAILTYIKWLFYL